jgi:antirestriction protein ArdC
VIENQAAYIKHWLDKLRLQDNKRVLMQAVSAAQKACDHIRAIKYEQPEEIKEAVA